jgi:hypothetical protein
MANHRADELCAAAEVIAAAARELGILGAERRSPDSIPLRRAA